MQNILKSGQDSKESSLTTSSFMRKVQQQLANSKKLLENAPKREK